MIHKKLISHLLLICFSVILGHQWIPHHHHTEMIPPEAEGHCPLDHADQHHQEEQPFHCHALNDLAFFKEDLTDGLHHIPVTEGQGVITSVPGISGHLPFTGISYHPMKVPDMSVDDPGIIPTRGPPERT